MTLSALMKSGGSRHYWLKPIGLHDRPMERQPEVFPESELNIHFHTDPAAVAEGDILIGFRTGKSKLIWVAERLAGGPWPSEDDKTMLGWVRERFPWFYKARNLTPEFGIRWDQHKLKPFTLVDEYNAAHSDKQPMSLGALQFGNDKLQIEQQFAEFLIRKILECDS
jgi:hypothetical protein